LARTGGRPAHFARLGRWGVALGLLVAGAADATVISFDGLAPGTVVTDQFPPAVFSTLPGFDVERSSLEGTICAGDGMGAGSCTNPLFVDFTRPVQNLSLFALVDEMAGLLSADVFSNGQRLATQQAPLDGDPASADRIDLSAFADVTRVELRSSDPAGVAYDLFVFDEERSSGAFPGDLVPRNQLPSVVHPGLVRRHRTPAVQDVRGGDPRIDRAVPDPAGDAPAPDAPVTDAPDGAAPPTGRAPADADEARRATTAVQPGGWLGSWGTIRYIHASNSAAAARAESDVATVAIGADYRLLDRVIVGNALFYDHLSLDAKFIDTVADLESGGFSPYVAWVIDDRFDVDAILSANFGSMDVRSATGNGQGTRDARSWSLNLNLNAVEYLGGWAVLGRAGLLYADARFGAFTDDLGTRFGRFRTELTQLQLAIELNYAVQGLIPGAVLLPYAGLGYNADVQRSQEAPPGAPDGRQEAEIRLGAILYGASRWSGFLDFATAQGREDYSSYTLSANLRCAF